MNSYLQRRSQIEHYFDRTALAAWERLTSDAPVGRIRRTVRAGRDQMRATLLSYLPNDMSGMRLLDAGCGTGALSVEAARRGAKVLAIDISPKLIEIARQRLPEALPKGITAYEAKQTIDRIDFRAGDMLDDKLGEFDYVVAMDSFIHYAESDVVSAVERLAKRTSKAIAFTSAPSSPALQVMHKVGRLFPSANRAPSIEPIKIKALQDSLDKALTKQSGMQSWHCSGSDRISSGFYTSHALKWERTQT